MKGLGFIIFIIVVQAISALVQYRKKQEDRKKRELAARQRAAGQVVAQAPSTNAVQRPATPTAKGTDRSVVSSSADLEDRRRAQLEQLRQRREVRRTGAPAPLPTPSSKSQPRRGAPIPQQPATRTPMSVAPPLGTSDQARSRAQEAASRARDAERQQRELQQRIVAQKVAADDKASRRTYDAGFAAVASETPAPRQAGAVAQSAMAVAVGRPGSGDRAGVTAAAFGLRLRDRASIRDVIVMTEILGKPVSLREE